MTSRIKPPVLILGHFHGVETGIRQLIREKPLDTTIVRGIRIPTIEEMARIKGYLIVKRNATRDFLDFCALGQKIGQKIGDEGLKNALTEMDNLYPQKGAETVLRQLCKQLAEPRPYDLNKATEDLRKYKGLKAPWNDWEYVRRESERLSGVIFELIMDLEQEHGSSPHR